MPENIEATRAAREKAAVGTRQSHRVSGGVAAPATPTSYITQADNCADSPPRPTSIPT